MTSILKEGIPIMIDPLTQHILNEGYLLSDKTISVNLFKFESGEAIKLLIIGTLGSGKTSLGKYLMKKYKVKEFFSDKPGLKIALKSHKRMIMETIEIASLYKDKPEFRKIILSHPMILMGMSALKSGLRADKRDGTVPGKVKDKKDTYISARHNISYFQKRLNYLRKDAMKIPGADIKEFEVPIFEPVYY